ncbi:hypothetical protein ANCDUO_16669 [Ancylostoma duodenale]|uniref:Uncharacterized protein n=1 Tax=Ancylostoma duodenale TaxID=51022 RepID=A0A0C2CTT9_9BILA|nr:hypothetical protein ANCDUO_16669 [Ancylostoma duodenale]
MDVTSYCSYRIRPRLDWAVLAVTKSERNDPPEPDPGALKRCGHHYHTAMKCIKRTRRFQGAFLPEAS